MSATARMIRGIYDAVAHGFEEAGIPLSDEQLAFLDESLTNMDPLAEAFS